MNSLVIFEQKHLGEDDPIMVKESNIELFWSGGSSEVNKMSNLYGLDILTHRGFKSVEHAMQSMRMIKDAHKFLLADGALGSFKSLRANKDCNALVSILFPKSKKTIEADEDPFARNDGIGFWYKKGMDGILAKMAVKQATSLRLIKSANTGKIECDFKMFQLKDNNTISDPSNSGMRNPSTWHRVLMEKFYTNNHLRTLLLSSKDKRLVEFVRGKHAATNHWGGKLVATTFNGKACKRLVGGNTMGLYLEHVRDEILSLGETTV